MLTKSMKNLYRLLYCVYLDDCGRLRPFVFFLATGEIIIHSFVVKEHD